jgi:hypothetical protein
LVVVEPAVLHSKMQVLAVVAVVRSFREREVLLQM